MISIKYFGEVPAGNVYAARITNAKGEYAEIITLGATLRCLAVNDKNGKKRDVVLGYDSPMDYLSSDGYLGATVGRYANRIDGPAFTIGGKTYPLFDTSGRNVSLHGGVFGFNSKLFTVSEDVDAVFARPGKIINLRTKEDSFEGEGNSLRFSIFSPDMEEGFPGNLFLTVKVSFTDDSKIEFVYEATSDKDTVFNVTNHSYFNLDGHDCGHDALATKLCIDANAVTVTDDRSVPNGDFENVEGTPFDFRCAKPIAKDIDGDHYLIRFGSGYDHNFVTNNYCPGKVRDIVVASSDESGITLTCATDLPGIQLYTANYLTSRIAKDGAHYDRRFAFCLETQKYPNSPNIPHFPSTLLKGGEQLTTVTSYSFKA